MGVENMNMKEMKRQTELAVALAHYTTPGDPQYDPEFDAEIRRLRPDWFTPEDEKEAKRLLRQVAQGDEDCN